MTTTAQQTPTIYDIKPGDTVTIPAYKAELTITVAKTFVYDEVMHLTDTTGWDHDLYPGENFRFVHRARR